MDLLAPHLPGFIAAYSILLVAAFSPGPAVALLMGIAMNQGRGAALLATFGIACGSIVINIATLVGVGLILQRAAWAIGGLRLIGAAYLLWLAYGALRKAISPPEMASTAIRRQHPARLFLTGFLMQATNPKAIVFWLAIASIGATKGGGFGVVALFVAGAFLISFICHGAWAMLLSAVPIRNFYARSRRWVEGVLGTLFTLFALRLAFQKG